MYQPRRAAAPMDLVEPGTTLGHSESPFGAPRRAARTWRDAVADRTAPFVLTLATAATVGSLVLASGASASTGQVAIAMDGRTTDQVSRSNTRVALAEVPPASTKTVAEVAIVATRTMYAKDALVVREEADAKSDKVASLKRGAEVHATPESDGKFRMVEYKGELAWVLDDALTSKKPVDDATSASGTPDATRAVPGGSVLGLKPVAMVVYRAVMARWDVPSVGGYRAHSLSVHQYGRAIDFMVYKDWTMGDQIAAFLIANAKQFKVDHIIWRQRIWTPSSPSWRHMADRGGVTANHYDHVHVAVRP